jgi:hypothetical protein
MWVVMGDDGDCIGHKVLGIGYGILDIGCWYVRIVACKSYYLRGKANSMTQAAYHSINLVLL